MIKYIIKRETSDFPYNLLSKQYHLYIKRVSFISENNYILNNSLFVCEHRGNI